jgi:ribosomal protein S18 acetylase RimI-like enzyme
VSKVKPVVTIREFLLTDYNSVVKLWDKAGLHYRPKGRDSHARIEKELSAGNAIFLVAEVDGKIIGTALGTHDGRKGWVNRVAVAKDYQKSGIARRLVTEIEKRFDKLGLDVIACLIEKDNTTSMKAFERLGYERWNGYYYSKRKSGES